MLKITNFTKKYPRAEQIAVDNLSIELKEGEIFGFLGKNGSGKSTTIKCLTGIQPFEQGEITICGYNIKTQPIEAKMNMGYVPDNHAVYEKLTGREFLNYVADLYDVSLEDRNKSIEKYVSLFKLENALDIQIRGYSHGMKQKICIMGALIHNPRLWILDEPMVGLDPQSMAEIIVNMKEHTSRGNTVFFSSHNLDLVARLCDRAAIINEGKLIDVIDLSIPKNKIELEEKFMEATGVKISDEYYTLANLSALRLNDGAGNFNNNEDLKTDSDKDATKAKAKSSNAKERSDE